MKWSLRYKIVVLSKLPIVQETKFMNSFCYCDFWKRLFSIDIILGLILHLRDIDSLKFQLGSK